MIFAGSHCLDLGFAFLCGLACFPLPHGFFGPGGLDRFREICWQEHQGSVHVPPTLPQELKNVWCLSLIFRFFFPRDFLTGVIIKVLMGFPVCTQWEILALIPSSL